MSTPSCTIASTAVRWNGLYGHQGERINAMTVTKIGLNGLIIVPAIGWCTIDPMVDDLSRRIRIAGGDEIRLVEFETAYHWYLLPPISFFFTPVTATVTAEYVPSAEALQRQDDTGRARWSRRADRD